MLGTFICRASFLSPQMLGNYRESRSQQARRAVDDFVEVILAPIEVLTSK